MGVTGLPSRARTGGASKGRRNGKDKVGREDMNGAHGRSTTQGLSSEALGPGLPTPPPHIFGALSAHRTQGSLQITKVQI